MLIVSGTTTSAGAIRRSAWETRRRFVDYLPFLFILTLIMPYRIWIGPLALSPDRILLLFAVIPCLVILFSGRVGRLLITDFLVIGHAILAGIAYLFNHNMDGIEPSGMYFVEVVGSYLVARCFVRSAETFRRVVKLLFLCAIFLLPFMLFEAVTGQNILIDLFGLLGPVIDPVATQPRLGLNRASGAFSHPIIAGTFCASVLGLSYYVFYRKYRMFMTLVRSALVSAATALSLSTAPLLTLILQYLFIGWDHVTRHTKGRWWVVFWAAIATYFAIDLLSNRSPVQVIASYLTFSPHSGYWRIHIWNYAGAEVLRHPLMGIGFNDWARPAWMHSSSVDNFWLLTALRSGLPSFALLAGGLLAMCIAVGRVRLRNPEVINYRRGWMITVIGLMIAGCTVHYWAAIFYHFMFLAGAMAWLLGRGGRTTRGQPSSRPARKTHVRPIPFG